MLGVQFVVVEVMGFKVLGDELGGGLGREAGGGMCWGSGWDEGVGLGLGLGGHTRPEEAPVATMVLVREVVILRWVV